MKMKACIAAILAVAGLALGGCDSTDKYPEKNIEGIIAWGAGGGTDAVSRRLTPAVQKALGRNIRLSNKTGATGSIAMQAVNEAKADGYTLLYHAENPALYQVLDISPLSYDDFEPIMLFVQGATVIVVPKASPFKTYADLIAAAKADPGKVTIGISGIGGQPHVTSLILNKIEGVTFKPVAFEGDGPLITALLNRQVEVSGLAIGAAAQNVGSGAFRALAIMKDSENPALQGVPAITKLNPAYSDIMKTPGFFYGVWVKKGTPQPIIDKLTAAFKTAFDDPTFKDFAEMNGFTLMGLTGKEAKDYIKSWQSQMTWLIHDAGGAKQSPDKFGIPRPAGSKPAPASAPKPAAG